MRRMFSLPRNETDPFRQPRDQNMAVPTSCHCLSSYPDGQEDSDGYRDWQSWEDGHMQTSLLPVSSYRDLQAGTDACNVAALMDVQNAFNMSPTGSNARLSGLDGHVNVFHNLLGSSDMILSQTDPAALLGYQFGEWNWVSSSASFPTPLANPPSMPNLDDHSTLSQTMLTDLSGFGGLGNNGVRSAEVSNPGSHELLIAHPGCYHFPLLLPVK
jgi:hypothetical protein